MTVYGTFREYALAELIDEQGTARPLFELNHQLLQMAQQAVLDGDRPLAAALLEAGRAVVAVTREYGEGLLDLDALRHGVADGTASPNDDENGSA